MQNNRVGKETYLVMIIDVCSSLLRIQRFENRLNWPGCESYDPDKVDCWWMDFAREIFFLIFWNL